MINFDTLISKEFALDLADKVENAPIAKPPIPDASPNEAAEFVAEMIGNAALDDIQGLLKQMTEKRTSLALSKLLYQNAVGSDSKQEDLDYIDAIDDILISGIQGLHDGIADMTRRMAHLLPEA